MQDASLIIYIKVKVQVKNYVSYVMGVEVDDIIRHILQKKETESVYVVVSAQPRVVT